MGPLDETAEAAPVREGTPPRADTVRAGDGGELTPRGTFRVADRGTYTDTTPARTTTDGGTCLSYVTVDCVSPPDLDQSCVFTRLTPADPDQAISVRLMKS